MYKKILDYLSKKPDLYQKSTAPFWDDIHISKGMLEAHLSVNIEAASRKYDFILESVEWIANHFLNDSTTKLLDLGCGPGLYTELFCKTGFSVTGIDFSKRSIDYAKKSASSKALSIEYFYKNYLEIDFEAVFDVVTLIYCDFGVLSPEERKILLSKIKKALKPNGTLILDGFTLQQMEGFSEGRTVEYMSQGFWSPCPHLCIQCNYYYPETSNYLEQYVIVTESECQCYNNWNQIFSAVSLKEELKNAGFKKIELYDNVAGKAYTNTSNTICAVAQ
ncbi:MAG: methyltransferase domain-containing protein [Anaerovorax sp.]|nr:methyltransferase domain-containing protein [Anaerovorax sp.]